MAALVMLVGCVSTQERFEKAQAFRADGAFEQAAYQYIEVLEREANFPNARRELLDVAQKAIDRRWAGAQQADDDGAPVRAAQELDALQRLADACAGVEVDVPMPDGYASYADAVDDRAADALIADAETARDAGDWPAAEAAYREAQTYIQSDVRLRRIDVRIAEVLMEWADDDMQQGRFRTAYERVARVPDLVGSDHPLVAEAMQLRRTAVEQGTEPVALVPFWRTDEAARQLPANWLSDFNIAMQTRYASPPPFLITADPIATRRMLRGASLDDRVLSVDDALYVGRQLKATFVIVGDIVAFRTERTDVEAETRTAAVTSSGGRKPTSGRSDATGPDTTFVVERYDLAVEAVASYRVVDVRTGRVVAEGERAGGSEGPVEEGRYAGDWRTLDLSGREVDYFDPDVIERQRRPIYDAALDALVDGLSEETFAETLQEIE